MSTRIGNAAINWARGQIENPNQNYKGLCLAFTRLCYGVSAKFPDANKGWAGAKRKHITANSASIPAGVPVWWAIGKHGHVAISVGNGRCISTDILRTGKPDEVAIDTISKKWGASLRGWSEDINGATVYSNSGFRMSVSGLRSARVTDPPKSGTPSGPFGVMVYELESALVATNWLSRDHWEGHYGSATVKAVQAFQRKHSGAKNPDGWLGPRELRLLANLANRNWNVED